MYTHCTERFSELTNQEHFLPCLFLFQFSLQNFKILTSKHKIPALFVNDVADVGGVCGDGGGGGGGVVFYFCVAAVVYGPLQTTR